MLFVNVCKAQNPYEVTPKSTASEHKPTDDPSDFVNQFPYLKMADWPKGMRFMVEPNRDDEDYHLKLLPYGSNARFDGPNSMRVGLRIKDFEYRTFVVDTIEYSNPVPPTARISVVFTCGGEKYQYYTGFMFKNEFSNSNDAYIDHFVYLNDIDVAKPLLLGKKLYILSSNWGGDKSTINNSERYVPVQVTKVGLGTSDKPVRIVFKPEGQEKEAYIDVCLSGTNSLLGSAARDFDEAFSFNDPKITWKGIRKKMWNLIEHGKVKAGMYKDECRLSWGDPKNVNTTNSGHHVDEQWVYGESYLYFTDGVLTTIQN